MLGLRLGACGGSALKRTAQPRDSSVSARIPKVFCLSMSNLAVPLADAAHTLDEDKFVRFPGSPFQLYQPYPPAGDQPEAIRQLVEGIEDGLSADQ